MVISVTILIISSVEYTGVHGIYNTHYIYNTYRGVLLCLFSTPREFLFSLPHSSPSAFEVAKALGDEGAIWMTGVLNEAMRKGFPRSGEQAQ